jgi:transglutaminase-like putative cysteine protease
MKQAQPDRWGLNGLLMTSVLVLAPHALRLPGWIVLVCAGALAWRFAVENRGWHNPHAIVRIALTALVAAAIYEHYGTLLGRDAGTGFLAALLALKFLELRQWRDCLVIVFLCQLLLLAGFLYSQSVGLATYSLLVIVICMASVVRLNQPTGMLLRDYPRLASALLLKAVPLMLAMFVLFPRIHGSLWRLPSDAYSGVTGISEVMRPGSLSRLSVSDAPAFRVEFDGKPPHTEQLYWRGMVLWHTDGQRWVAGKAKTELDSTLSFEHLGAPVRYTITAEPSNKPWMLALDLPLLVPRQARVRAGHLLEHRTPVHKRKSYTLVSYLHYNTGALTPAERDYALQLPDQVSARTRALANEWRQSSGDNLAIAQSALDYFRRLPFFYTLEPPRLGKDPVDEFLFSTRRGFCGHFTSAFVTLMRAAGVPSRVVQGYQGGEFNPAGGYLLVRQADAHAWAEIWQAGRGWVRIDPTAAVAPERVQFGIDTVRRLHGRGIDLGNLSADAVRRLIELGWFEAAWRGLRFYWDATNLAWHRSVLGYGRARQERLLAKLSLPELSAAGLLAALAVTVVIGLILLALSMHRARRHDPTHAAYLVFCNKLRRIDIARADTEGALMFARRVAALRPDLQTPVGVITDLYLRIRYGGLVGAEPVRVLKQKIAQFQPARRLFDTN